MLRRLGLASAGLAGAALVADTVINDEVDEWTRPITRRLRRPPLDESGAERKRRVVVLGTGWASLSFVRKLDLATHDVTVVSPRPYFFYTPLLPGCVSGCVSEAHVLEPIRNFCDRVAQRAHYVCARAERIDLGARVVHCGIDGGGALSLPYDELVVAVGTRPNPAAVEGGAAHALPLTELEDATRLRTRLFANLERASALQLGGAGGATLSALVRVVVIGGPPAAVELAAELCDLQRAEVARAFPTIAHQLPAVTLVDASPRLLPMFDAPTSEYAAEHLRARGVDVRAGCSVRRVRARGVEVVGADGRADTIDAGIVVWAAAKCPHPITDALRASIGAAGAQADARGLRVDGRLRVLGCEHVWALGDCARSGYPPTGQVAVQQGKYLGRLFSAIDVASADARATAPPFEYHHLGTLAYIGGSEAIARLPSARELLLGGNTAVDHAWWRAQYVRWLPDEPISAHGPLTFAAWRSVYFSKLLSARNRVGVLTDWAHVCAFGRTTAVVRQHDDAPSKAA